MLAEYQEVNRTLRTELEAAQKQLSEKEDYIQKHHIDLELNHNEFDKAVVKKLQTMNIMIP